MPILLQLQKLPWKGDGGWKKVSFRRFFLLTRRLRVCRKKCVLGHPIAWATSYYLLPDTLWLQASKNAFKVGSVKFANSLSLPSIVKKAHTGSKSNQRTLAMPGKSQGSWQPRLNRPIPKYQRQCLSISSHLICFPLIYVTYPRKSSMTTFSSLHDP